MIVICPACATRYRVSEEELAAPAGRMVRCANCGEVWRQASSPAQVSGHQAISIGVPPHADPVGEAVSRPVSAPGLDIRPRAQPGLPRVAAQPRRRRRTALGRAIMAIVLLLALAAAAGIIAHRHMAAIWPPSGRLYASIGLAAEPAGTGLVIDKIVPVRTADGLMIDGEIANRGSAPEIVPRLRVVLQDAAKKDVQLETMDPPKARLRPGEIVHFAASFAHPADAATGVVVTFASR
ncbi:MAG TPA: zinc-ribbon domain-containing protein [Stellaceae bacterium]|jgi:predicted Zn finger-like uncharacterized protein